MSARDYETERGNSLAEEIIADYERRREERRPIEAQWRINANFVSGKQNCYRAGGSIIEEDKRRLFTERAVFNHVASVYEARLGKLYRLRPHLSVRPPRGDDGAVLGARLSSAVLECACERMRMPDLISEATSWSELTGTAFYKVSWDRRLGRIAGELDGEVVCEGEVRVDVVSPYEIFPDSVYAPSVEACRSIIHAKALPVTEISDIWGDVEISEEGYSTAQSLALTGETVSLPRGYALVLERFTRGDEQNPTGRYEVVVGNKLVYEGELPFGGGELPFIRQCCAVIPGRFFGVSPIERAVPIQRAYNAVKNRKHEFMNRLAAGVLVVEDGSVDVDDLEEGGLEPGKIIVYRQGATAPAFLPMGELPKDFGDEEDKLLEEMSAACGVSEIMRSGSSGTVSSGSALQLLIEQDDARLSVASDNIASAVRLVGRRILDLYAECSGSGRLKSRLGLDGDGLWSGSDVICRDVTVECSPELEGSRPNRRALVLELYRAGLFDSENGRVSEPTRRRILQALGYGYIEQSSINRSLHEARATRENVGLTELCVKPYDDHAAHVEEHVAYMLEKELTGELESALAAHVKTHEQFLSGKTEE